MTAPSQNEIRRLAAVMFTDLEGYTSMFQQNETAALEKIKVHRQYLDEITSKHHGRIVQFYGDGSLVVYDSVIDAIRSAIELQASSKKWQIPLRVGIHIGDVVFKDDDIFGDAVNVASRIQTIGVPGSIVVSGKVADELKNQPEISTTRLGAYSLKNVKEEIELFAITGSGLITPPLQISNRKKSKTVYYLLFSLIVFVFYIIFFKTDLLHFNRSRFQEERIVIPPFQDYTSDPHLSLLGDMVSNIITNDLNESNADVVTTGSALLYTNANMASMINSTALARQTGAAIILKGAYSFSGSKSDSLMFWASIYDGKTNNQLLVFPKIYCASDNPMDCIREMSNVLRGYWKSKGDHVFKYTTYDAYVAFIRAQKIWANPDPEIKKKAKEYLIQAISYDSLFLDAYFLLIDGFHNEGDYKNEKDTIELVRTRFDNLSQRQENYLQYYEDVLEGRNLDAFNHFIKEYPYDPKDLFINTTGMVLAIEFLNDPIAALRLNDDIKIDSLDLRNCAYCRTRINMAMQAYAGLPDNANAKKLADKLKPFAGKAGQFTRLIGFYMSINDTVSVNEVIRLAAKDTIEHNDNYQFYCLVASRYAMINNHNDLRDDYANKAIQRYGTESNGTLGQCYYLKGDLEKAEKIFNAEIQNKPSAKKLYALNTNLGMVYARRGETEKANKIISNLEIMKQDFDLGKTAYYQGRIKALLGEKEAAIQYLTKALDEGRIFQAGTTFQDDPDLIGLSKEPKYLALLKRNRQM